MPKIKQLDPHVADLIAAGEVVERPASVVKELMENAIDAGATSVTVEIQNGGMGLIRVTDNGCGIAWEDAETAFLRHATSKIRSEYDLEAIGTLGFRGEALAAISAVSKVELLTRRPEDEFGTALMVDGGAVRTKEEAGCPAGTTLIVRNLFYNTPARLKFMKRDSTEGAAVAAVVQHTALSHPEVAVTFVREGKNDLRTPGDGQLKNTLYTVLGRDMALGFLPVSGSGEGIDVGGFVSMPSCCKGTRGNQYFFLNGRYIKSRTILAALEEAYRNRKMVGKFPACVLQINVKLNSVDVNVHPTKTEVKFTDERALFNAVYHTVKDTLDQRDKRVQMELTPAAEPQTEPGQTAAPAAKPPVTPVRKTEAEVRTERPASPPPAVSYTGGRKNFFQTMTTAEYRAQAAKQRLEESRAAAPAAKPQAEGTSEPLRVRDGGRMTYRLEDTAADTAYHRLTSPVTEEVVEPAEEPVEPVSAPEPPAVENLTAPAEPEEKYPAPAPELSTEVGNPEENPEEEPPAEEPVLSERVESEPEETEEPRAAEAPQETGEQIPMEGADREEPWRLAGELFHTYILVEQGDRVLLIDKHAAHERMNFDRLKQQGYRPMAQQLLVPVVFTPGREEGETLLRNAELLMEFGFECEDFGDGALVVRQIPCDIDAEQAEITLCELASKLMVTGTADPDSARDDLLHTIACKAAIKGGQHSGEEELRVVAEAVMRDEVRYCPHGRPVAVELSRKQLEKQFKRI